MSTNQEQTESVFIDAKVLWALLPERIPGRVIDRFNNDHSRGFIRPSITLFYPNGEQIVKVFSNVLDGIPENGEVLFEHRPARRWEKEKQNQPDLIEAVKVEIADPERIDEYIHAYTSLLAAELRTALNKKIAALDDELKKISAEVARQVEEIITPERQELSKRSNQLDEREKGINHREKSMDKEIENRVETALAERKLTLDTFEQILNIREIDNRTHEDNLSNREKALAAEWETLTKAQARFEREGGKAYIEYLRAVTGEDKDQPVDILSTDAPISFEPENIKAALARQGYHLEESSAITRVIVATLAAWDSGQFVLLTGPTGVGKTQLVRHLATILGAGSGDISVRPGWTDPSDLLGFYNAMHRLFEPTPFLSKIQEAARWQEANRLYLLCLDEMNLSRIENYAADLLSQYERRGAGQDAQLDLYSSDIEKRLRLEEQLLCRANGNLSPDQEAHKRMLTSQLEKYPGRLRIPRSLVLFGTVNVDETTHLFSPKFLDRSYVLRFPPVDLDKAQYSPPQNLKEFSPTFPLSLDQADELLPRPDELEHTVKILRKDLLKWQQETLPALGVQLGYRFLNGFRSYVSIGTNLGVNAQSLADDYFVAKLLPRIRFGIDEQVNDGSNRRKYEIFEEWHRKLDLSKYKYLINLSARMLKQAEHRGMVEFWE